MNARGQGQEYREYSEEGCEWKLISRPCQRNEWVEPSLLNKGDKSTNTGQVKTLQVCFWGPGQGMEEGREGVALEERIVKYFRGKKKPKASSSSYKKEKERTTNWLDSWLPNIE